MAPICEALHAVHDSSVTGAGGCCARADRYRLLLRSPAVPRARVGNSLALVPLPKVRGCCAAWLNWIRRWPACLLRLLVLQDRPVEHVVPLVPCESSHKRAMSVLHAAGHAATLDSHSQRPGWPPCPEPALAADATPQLTGVHATIGSVLRPPYNLSLAAVSRIHKPHRILRFYSRTFSREEVAEQLPHVGVVWLVVESQRPAVLEERYELQREPFAQHLHGRLRRRSDRGRDINARTMLVLQRVRKHDSALN